MSRARFPAGVHSTHYARGTILWHGTAHVHGVVEPQGPMWFSDSIDVARWFSSWRVGRHDDRRREVPRITKWIVTAPFSLPTFNAQTWRREAETGWPGWMERVLRIPLEDAQELMADGSDALAEAFCKRGLAGWRLVMNYDTGDDIMLCHPERYLRRVPARSAWRP